MSWDLIPSRSSDRKRSELWSYSADVAIALTIILWFGGIIGIVIFGFVKAFLTGTADENARRAFGLALLLSTFTFFAYSLSRPTLGPNYWAWFLAGLIVFIPGLVISWMIAP